MPHRKRPLSEGPVAPRARAAPVFVGLRGALRDGYDGRALRADLMAGLVVGIVALPLSMALAVATGVPPQHGLYTAIVAGAIVAVLGGSRFQVTGPTAAFVVILAPIVAKHGLSGLLTAGLLAGVMLIAMGFARLGRLISFIPHPVTTGFTAGIATVIATLQIKDALGLTVTRSADAFPDRVAAMWEARSSAQLSELVIAASTLFLLLIVPKITKRIPAPLIAIGLVALAAFGLDRLGIVPLHVATIGTRFHTLVDGVDVAGIPRLPPEFGLPWGDSPIGFELLRELLMPAFAIAMLGAIESLLSAVVADGMTGERHDPNAELIALGVGNIVAPFFGGIAATGALARTATNVRSGARSPIAAIVHSAVVLLSVLLAAPLIAYIPMASLAGLLLLVAWNMSEVRHFVHVVRVAPKSDVVILLVCFGLTVIVDMVFAVSIGVVLAALLFMRRMADLTHSEVTHAHASTTDRKLPAGAVLYRIAGPLFFGAAQKAMGAFDEIRSGVRVVVLDLSEVPTIDATGLVALESALSRLNRAERFVVLTGPLPVPRDIFVKAELESLHPNLVFADTLDQGLAIARDLVTLNPAWGAASAGS